VEYFFWCFRVVARVAELTEEVTRLREADQSNQEMIRHYDAQLAVFSLHFFDMR